MTRRVLVSFAVSLVAALVTQGCGSDSPTASSSAGGVVVQGVVLGDAASVSAAADWQPASSQAKKIKVRVDGTSLDVDVSVNGTFELKGVPSGTFTLVFLADGVEVGRVVVSAAEGSEVKIVVQVTAGALVVVEIKVDGTDSGTPPAATGCAFNGGTLGQGVEIEGDVLPGGAPPASFQMTVNGRSSLPVDVQTGSSTSFECIGSAKTTSDAECRASVKAGAKLHVSGTLSTCTSSKVEVTASQVKVQKG